MIYVVNTDIEVEAVTPDAAEDLVMDMLSDKDGDFFAGVIEVRELNG